MKSHFKKYSWAMHINTSFLSRSKSMGVLGDLELYIPFHSKGKKNIMEQPKVTLISKGKTNISMEIFSYREFKNILENALKCAKQRHHLKRNIYLLCVYYVGYRVKKNF